VLTGSDEPAILKHLVYDPSARIREELSEPTVINFTVKNERCVNDPKSSGQCQDRLSFIHIKFVYADFSEVLMDLVEKELR